MATSSNSGPAENDLERGGAGQSRGGSIPRIIRDTTFKIIPFCCFCLVVFSVGAILVSTLAFDKPTPHKGTIVISILLLSFFALFCMGFVYLYLRKTRPKSLGPTGSSRRNGCRNYRAQDYAQGTTRVPKRSSGEINPAVPRGANGGLTDSDTLRVQPPSPNTYRRGAEDHGSVPRHDNEPHEVGKSIHQQNRHLAQQQGHQMDKGGHRRSSRSVQLSDPEVSRLHTERGRNVSIQTNATSATLPRYKTLHSNTQNTQEDPLDLPPVGGRVQSPSIVSNGRQTIGSGSHVGQPIPRRPVRGPRDMPRDGTPSQVPSLNVEIPEPSLPSSPDPTRERQGKLKDPDLGEYTRNTPGSRIGGSERRRLGRNGHVSPWPYIPATGQGMSIQDKRDSVKGVLRFYGYSDVGDSKQGHDIPPVSRRQHPIPVGDSSSPAQAGSNDKALNAKNKQRPPYPEYDMSDYAGALRDSSRPGDHGQLRAVGSGSSSANTRGKLRVMITSASDEDDDPQASRQEDRKPVHQTDNKLHIAGTRSSLEVADAVNIISPGRTLAGPTPPGPPTPNQSEGFNPRHLSAVPEPLKIANKNQPIDTVSPSSDYNPLGYNLEMKPQLPTPALFTKPRPPTMPSRPAVSEDEEEEEGVGGNRKEASGTLVWKQGHERIKGRRGGDHRRPQIPERRSSRKSRRGGSNTSTGLHIG
ncbi:hypothetical protein ANO14919_085100 [Xylariales sp. No.14919]|nr:hypothetical protein ANO14919_085100 [Xylariales sp. No.14919]